MKQIYRTYADTEVSELQTSIKCPYCGNEWMEPNMDGCGETYVLTCDKDEDGCGKQFEMYFDAS